VILEIHCVDRDVTTLQCFNALKSYSFLLSRLLVAPPILARVVTCVVLMPVKGLYATTPQSTHVYHLTYVD
jgi:hypothetical protein